MRTDVRLILYVHIDWILNRHGEVVYKIVH